LAVSIDENRVTAALVHSIYPGDEGGCLTLTDADGVGLIGNTAVADINVVIARELVTSANTYCDVVVASAVASERSITDCRVVASGVAIERPKTVGRVAAAG
jgi:hypothetical protein